METIDITKLSDEQKKGLSAQLKAEELASEQKKKNERRTYKELTSGLVNEMIAPLQKTSSILSGLKQTVFKNFESLLQMKRELYGVKADQQTYTFSNTEQTAHVKIGYRKIDGYDDTVHEGVAKVREFVEGLAKDEQSAKLMKVINGLLKPDKAGNFKISRAAELQNSADDLANEPDIEKFTDGIRIIIAAYKPQRSVFFVEAEVKNGAGAWVSVPLSVSAANFPEGFEVKF